MIMIPHFIGHRYRRACVWVMPWLAVWALWGCSLAPVYERPIVPVPSTFSGDTLAAATRGTGAGAEIHTEEMAFLAAFAPDRDLAPLVSRALAHSPDFRLAALRVDAARAQYRIQRADSVPALSAGLAQARQRFDNADLDARYQQNLRTATLGIGDFELDFFGRVKSLSDAARERFLASRRGQEAARGALIAEVLRAYAMERAAAQEREHAQAIDADSASMLRFAVRRHEVGLISRDDLHRQQARSDQARVAALEAADAHRAALRALQVLAGYDVVPDGGGMEALAGPQAPLDALRDLDSQKLLLRPDIRQAEAELQAAHADIGAARAAFFPSIRLTTSAGTASQSLGGLFGSGTGVWSFMPQLALPIFDGGRNRANLDLAWTRQQAGVAEYERAVQVAFREVADALDAHTTLVEALRRQTDQDARVQSRVDRWARRTQAQQADRTELLSERIAAEQSAMSRLQAQRSLALNRIDLFRAFYGVPLPSSL
ncbi:efflux transporter outer membrane subunit [Paracidovorax konjaci]|uniref:Efflux transporter, outer membrane factor (OMF) lipoprotein, NodT family n=1 Tax=Paracidovorax konjaci TaxID=32040 RepID=A0A1I1UKF4_9BURK|nr:efflux transporter outer membrane subunit [Paracidovorax konjaci]SFD71306.1 efflux transporter, outer membrane factor (OMF) lipoprotein, NodT family [Paracidovorax konjaci]